MFCGGCIIAAQCSGAIFTSFFLCSFPPFRVGCLNSEGEGTDLLPFLVQKPQVEEADGGLSKLTCSDLGYGISSDYLGKALEVKTCFDLGSFIFYFFCEVVFGSWR